MVAANHTNRAYPDRMPNEDQIAASVTYWLATDQPRLIRPVVRLYRKLAHEDGVTIRGIISAVVIGVACLVAAIVLGNLVKVDDPAPTPADTDRGCVHHRDSGRTWTTGDCP
jgi:hypothetical protein